MTSKVGTRELESPAVAPAPPLRPARIAIYYIVGGLIWVVLSKEVLARIPAHSIALNRLMFVAVNALLIYLIALRYSKKIGLAAAAREEALARSRGYFQSAVEGLLTAGSDGAIRQVNPRALEIFGYTEAELVGQPIEVLMPKRLRDRHLDHRRTFFSDPRSRWMAPGMEVSGVHKDGTEIPVEVSLNVVSSRDGNIVIAFISDVRERRAMERESRRIETLNALGAVAAGIAHELNNPLAVISARIELMLVSNDELPPEMRADLLVLQSNVERASRISRNMLSLARQRPAVRQPFDVNAAVDEAMLLAGAESSSAKSRVRFETNLDRSLPNVFGDVTALQQVLINLLMNARDAGAACVRIESANSTDSRGRLQLTVSDDGGGIDADRIGKVFEPFFTTKAGGTGLGLWLSQRIVEDLGGTITVQSEAAKGTKFIVTLPALEQAPTDRGASSSAESPKLHTSTMRSRNA
jgi:PAS domain S-box-containing protein